MQELKIHTEYITLGQALKLANLTSSGVESKIVIAEGEVKVNGEVETCRGKKLRDGDSFSYDQETFVVHADPNA